MLPENLNNCSKRKEILGILGGTGPIASTKFLDLIYSSAPPYYTEQNLPRILLWSDPSVPDRTEFIRKGLLNKLSESLIVPLNKLLDMGATHLLICCFTAHTVAHLFPSNIKKRLINLPRLALDSVVSHKGEKTLVLCTWGSRIGNIFITYSDTKSNLMWPSFEEQSNLQNIIYRLKKNETITEILPSLLDILQNHSVGKILIACTELSTCVKELRAYFLLPKKVEIIDPLESITRWLYTEPKNYYLPLFEN